MAGVRRLGENAALGGVIQLFSEREISVAPTGTVTASAGNLGTRSVKFLTRQPAASGEIVFAGSIFRTDGFYALAASARGAIDRPLSSRHEVAHASWRRSIARELDVSVTGRWFVDERGNGTSLQQNRSREGFASIAVRRMSTIGANWSANA